MDKTEITGIKQSSDDGTTIERAQKYSFQALQIHFLRGYNINVRLERISNGWLLFPL